MAGQKIAKKLPKRAMPNHRSHTRNKECWLRGQKRKAARRAAQDARAAANRIRFGD